MWESLIALGNEIWAWFGVPDNQNRAQAIAAVVAVAIPILGATFGAIWFVAKVVLPGRQQSATSVAAFPSGDVLTMDQHLTILEKREQSLVAKLSSAHSDERDVLSRQIAELQAQIANPEQSLADAKKRIADLEALLEREGNDIAPVRIAEARAALERGDFSLADDLFVEIEARADIEVQRAARAAFGRGEVAEQEVRWADAAAHYIRAARLAPQFEALSKAANLTQSAGDYPAAERLAQDLVAMARSLDEPEKLSVAIDRHGSVLRDLGQFEVSERLFKQALDLDRQVFGAKHQRLMVPLNNLAGVLAFQGRYEEADSVYCEALEVGRLTVGEDHRDFVTILGNHASLMKDQGRFDEAEALYVKVLEKDRKTIGENHPEYATRLSNFAFVLKEQGRFDEAENLCRKVLEIDKLTIGENHPSHARHLNDLAMVIQAQGRLEEAERLCREVLNILSETVGERHPHYGISLNNLANVMRDRGQLSEAKELYERALAILSDTLPAKHPYVEKTKAKLKDLSEENN